MRGAQLRVRSSVFVDGETDRWMKRLIELAAVEQLQVAESQSAVLATALDATLATSEHPSSGRRDKADEMVSAVPAMTATRKASAWRDPEEFRITAKFLTAQGYLSTTDEGKGPFRGLTAEVPSGPRAGYAIQGGNSHLIMATTQHPHPTLGPGLLVRLLLQHSPHGPSGTPITAIDLNAWRPLTAKHNSSARGVETRIPCSSRRSFPISCTNLEPCRSPASGW